MKKLVSYLLIFVLAFSLCACLSSDDDEESGSRRRRNSSEETEATSTPEPDVTASIAPTDEPVSTPVVTATPEPTPEPTAEPTPTEEPTPTLEPEPTIIPGPTVNEVPDMQTVFDAYYEYVRNCMDEPDYTLWDTLRFGLALIDNDDIPELIVTEGDYHGSGVKVIFYNNGDLKEVGEFGEYGGFAYVKKENHIMSFYMGMGIRTLQRYHVDTDCTLVKDIDLYIDDDNGEAKINDEKVNFDTFEAAYNAASEPEFGNNMICTEYDDMLCYYPYCCDEFFKNAYEQMYDELIQDDYAAFSGYYNENMANMEGCWTLIKGSADLIDGYVSYDSERDDEWNQNAVICSEATVSKENGIGIWISAYKDDVEFGSFIADYAMPMVYYNNGISEALDYGWCVGTHSEDTEDGWEYYFCIDEEDHLCALILRDIEGEYDGYGYPMREYYDLTFARRQEFEACDVIEAFVERSEENDKDGKKAYIATEFLWITPDTPELFEEYGFPEDFDDYEIVESHREPFIFYVDDNTYYEILNLTQLMQNDITDYDGFHSREYGAFELYFNGGLDLSSVEGSTAIGVIEEYIG